MRSEEKIEDTQGVVMRNIFRRGRVQLRRVRAQYGRRAGIN
jgi:hypothetical protein